MGVKTIFLAYREWALEVYPAVASHPNVAACVLCKTDRELRNLDVGAFDLLVTCGWSEELGGEITRKIQAIGVHCAELDRYSYGTPLQLQIMDGIRYSKHRIFEFTAPEDSRRAHTHSRRYSHEVTLDLSGGMEQVLDQMTSTSITLFNMFLDDYPKISWKVWDEESIVRPRRSPEDSRLTKEDVARMTTEELYNFFRCLEDPYPNGYIEDGCGRLYIQKVLFKRK
jgi:hypothetical protein